MALGFLAQDADPLEAIVLPFVFVVPSWLVGDLVRTRRVEAARRAEEAERSLRSARSGSGPRPPRSAATWPASCTTSSPMRSA